MSVASVRSVFGGAGKGSSPPILMVDFWPMVGRLEMFRVLDRLRLFIPFRPELVTGGAFFVDALTAIDKGHKGIVDLAKLDAPLVGTISVGSDGKHSISELRHAWEKLPSSFTPLAFKIHNGGFSYPGIELKASPAKLLQGHNVFGPTSIQLGASEMLTTLSIQYPKLFDSLAVEATDVLELDATYSARLPSQQAAINIVQFLQSVSHGHRKARGEGYDTTAYFGKKDSRLVGLKMYLKSLEFMHQLEQVERDAKNGDASARRTLEKMSDFRLMAFVENLLRIEATVKKRWLQRREIPTRLIDLVKYQKQRAKEGVCILEEFWQEVTAPIFKAFEGATMKILDDEQVLNALKIKYVRYTKKGKPTYEYAKNLFRTFRNIREFGWDDTRESMAKTSFNRHVAQLTECGVSRAQLQNLKGHVAKNNVVPVLQFVKVDFSAQRPDWYVEPVSQYHSAIAA